MAGCLGLLGIPLGRGLRTSGSPRWIGTLTFLGTWVGGIALAILILTAVGSPHRARPRAPQVPVGGEASVHPSTPAGTAWTTDPRPGSSPKSPTSASNESPPATATLRVTLRSDSSTPAPDKDAPVSVLVVGPWPEGARVELPTVQDRPHLLSTVARLSGHAKVARDLAGTLRNAVGSVWQGDEPAAVPAGGSPALADAVRLGCAPCVPLPAAGLAPEHGPGLLECAETLDRLAAALLAAAEALRAAATGDFTTDELAAWHQHAAILQRWRHAPDLARSIGEYAQALEILLDDANRNDRIWTGRLRRTELQDKAAEGSGASPFPGNVVPGRFLVFAARTGPAAAREDRPRDGAPSRQGLRWVEEVQVARSAAAEVKLGPSDATVLWDLERDHVRIHAAAAELAAKWKRDQEARADQRRRTAENRQAEAKSLLDEGRKAEAASRIREAIRCYERIHREFGDTPPAGEASERHRAIESAAAERLREAHRLREGGDDWGAAAAYRELAVGFDGTNPAAAAGAQLRQTTDRLFQQAEAQERTASPNPAAETYRRLAKEFGGTSAGASSDLRLRQRRKEAREAFGRGKNWETNRMTQKALECYQEVLDKYPETDAAKEARERIAVLKKVR